MNVRFALALMIAVGGFRFIMGDKAAADDKPAMPADPQAKALAEWQHQMTGMFDVDKDGKLSDQEKLMMQQAMAQHGWNVGMMPGGFPGSDQFMKQFDLNKDGMLSDQEKLMAQAMFQRMRGNHGGMRGGVRSGGGASGFMPQPAMPILPAANNNPGKLSQLAKRFDKDGDGKLNADEKAALQAEAKKKEGKDLKKEDGKKDDVKKDKAKK